MRVGSGVGLRGASAWIVVTAWDCNLEGSLDTLTRPMFLTPPEATPPRDCPHHPFDSKRRTLHPGPPTQRSRYLQLALAGRTGLELAPRSPSSQLSTLGLRTVPGVVAARLAEPVSVFPARSLRARLRRCRDAEAEPSPPPACCGRPGAPPPGAQGRGPAGGVALAPGRRVPAARRTSQVQSPE